MKVNKFVLILFFILLLATTSLIVYYLIRNSDLKSEDKILVGSIPKLSQIEKNCKVQISVPNRILVLSKEKGWPLGKVESKDGNLWITIKEAIAGSLSKVDLRDVVRIEFREIADLEGYQTGKTDSFKNIIVLKGKPYDINQIYSYLPLGAQVWIFQEPEVGKVLMIYCSAI